MIKGKEKKIFCIMYKESIIRIIIKNEKILLRLRVKCKIKFKKKERKMKQIITIYALML